VLHTSLTGAAGHDTYAPTSLAVLAAKGYDYWALGHVHARQVVSENAPRIVFPGNLQGRHANETGPKGCELVTVDAGRIDATFIELDVVRWHQVTVALDGVEDVAQAAAQARKALAAATASATTLLHAVRVNLIGQTLLYELEAKQPGTLAAAVQAAAQDIGDCEVWIEQMRLAISSPIDRSQAMEGQDAIAELIRLVDELAADDATLADWSRQALGDVLAKLPPEVQADVASDGFPRLDDPASLRSLLADAEATLLARLNVERADGRGIR
jgi:DNA repair exonuclease SbcCD nuclease subunit